MNPVSNPVKVECLEQVQVTRWGVFMSACNLKRILPSVITLASFALPTAIAEHQPVNADHHKKHHEKQHKHHVPEVKHSIVVNAKAQHVWEAIQHNRKSDEHRKLLSYDGTAATLHETFASLPIVGEASCDYVENESQVYERIDYALVKSDRFHVFEGTWILTPGKHANETVVELTNALDPGIRVPFWQDITKMAASRLVKRRLEAISAYAENLQKHEPAAIR